MGGYGENGKGTAIADAAKERFLELIHDGVPRHLAAKAEGVEETSTRFRSLIRRDTAFRSRYKEALIASGRPEDAEQAEVEGLEKLQVIERLFDEYVERALDPERSRNGSSNRALQNLLTLMHETFKPFLEARMHRHIHTGAVGVFAMPQIDTARWTLTEHREFVALERRRNELLAVATPEDQKRELVAAIAAPPDDDEDTIDGYGEEIAEP